MKRHFLGVSLACVLAASTVLSAGGCKQKTDNSENTLEIYAAEFGYGYEWLNDMIAAFQEADWVKEKYPNLNIPAVKHNSNRSYAIDRIMQGETNTIDLFFAVTSGTDKFESTYGNGNPYFENLTSVYTAKVPGEERTFAEKMDANFLKMNTYTTLKGEETYYSVPWVAGMQGMLYNKTLFTELNLTEPNTTNELYELCEKLVDAGQTPFIFTSKENYWTCMMFLIWWAQYEGIDDYCNFYQGIVEEDGVKSYSKDIFKQTGRLRSLEVIEDLITYPTDFIHDDVNTLSFTQAQAKFLLRQGAMMPNGDWFETEMTKTAEQDNITDVFTFMKTPVISSIVETLEDKTMSDKTLSDVVAAVDNEQTSYPGVSENDFAAIKAARRLILPVGNHTAMIPAYSTAKEAAKDFLLFLATDKANEVFIKSTNGASMPFDYDIESKNPALYASLPEIQKTRLALQAESVYMLNENTWAGVYYGGIARFTGARTNIESLFTAKSEKDRKTARKIYDEEIEWWDDNRWDSVLTNMGRK